jgi:phage baseplate assembly protein W
MQLEFYSLPLTVERVMNKQEHPKCSLKQSVEQHLRLLTTTAFGGFPADEEFGCGIWEYDFDNVTGAVKLKEWIRQSLLEAIKQKERRLSGVRVDVALKQEEVNEASGRRVKKKIDITITGQLGLTNEKFGYRDTFFVGPLSY